MALETTTITPQPRLFNYSGITDEVRTRSIVPSAELVFSVLGEDVTAATGGAFQFLTINCMLPVNFSYVLADMSLEVEMAAAGNTFDWNAVGQMGVTDSAATSVGRIYSPNYELVSQGIIFDGSSDLTERRAYTPAQLPKFVIQAAGAQQARVAVTLFNPTANGAAAKATLLARFLVYGINQRHHFQTNTPVPTR